MIEHYYKPTIVLTMSEGVITGSARSIEGFNLYEALHECKEHLITFGGHFAAAGLTLAPENLQAFTDKFELVASKMITDEMTQPVIHADAEIAFHEINTSLINIIEQMEPFGPENMNPVFLTRNVRTSNMPALIKEMHIKAELKQDHMVIPAIGFKLAHLFPLLNSGQDLDILYHLSFNEWNGNKTIQLQIIDLKYSENP